MSASLTSQASLLGLPTEIRDQILREVFLLPINHLILTYWSHTHSAQNGFKDVPDLTDSPLSVPWLNLMLSCSTLYSEMRSMMEDVSYTTDEALHTYVLNLEGTQGGIRLGRTSWIRLPCPPQELKVLDVRYDANSGFQAWGDGGPHGITSGLYQTLNHLIHCGPRLDSRFPLDRPLHIHELRITVDRFRSRSDDEEVLSERATDPETTLYSLGGIVGQIVRTGVLKGTVDRIRMRSAGGKTLSWNPETVDGEGVPEYWSRYGFEWGMGLYQ